MAAIQKAPEAAPPARNGSNGMTKPAAAGSEEGLATPKPEHFIRVTKVARKVKDLICRFDDYDEPFFKGVTLHSYLQYIADERLRSMPRRGSDWDRVLSTAQFFGLQIWYFAVKIDAFATECLESASAALAGCQVLLEVCNHLNLQHEPPPNPPRSATLRPKPSSQPSRPSTNSP